MFQISICNKPLEAFQSLEGLSDLLKFQDSVTISGCAAAQLMPERQRDKNQVYTFSMSEALNFMLKKPAVFPIAEKATQSRYDAIVFLKNHADDWIDIYYWLDDDFSRGTLIYFLCYNLFAKEEMIGPISEPLVLICGKMRTQRINTLDELLQSCAELQKTQPKEKVNLRLVQREDDSIEVRLFFGDMEQQFGSTLPGTVQNIEEELQRVEELNQVVVEALQMARGRLQEGDFENMFALFAASSKASKNISDILQRYYPKQ